MQKPQNVAFLERGIRRMVSSNNAAHALQVTLANVVLGQMIPNAVVRGGSLMKLRFGQNTTRFTKDFDAAQTLAIGAFRDKLVEALRVGWEGFTGIVVDAPRARSTKRVKFDPVYLMTPFLVKLSYKGHAWITILLEVSTNEIGDAEKADLVPVPEEIAQAFETLGFSAPKPIRAMAIEYQIAQKLHGVTKGGNDRAHDLVDLQLIANNMRVPYKKVGLICRRLFAYRKQQPWPSYINYDNPNWASTYQAAAQGLAVFQTPEEAVPWGNAFIDKCIRYSKTAK